MSKRVVEKGLKRVVDDGICPWLPKPEKWNPEIESSEFLKRSTQVCYVRGCDGRDVNCKFYQKYSKEQHLNGDLDLVY